MIDEVAWPVGARNTRGTTRPEKLIAALIGLDLVSESCRFVNHGRGSAGEPLLSKALPSRKIQDAGPSTAILSPVFVTAGTSKAHWIDLYDDWSLAPNIHPLYRLLAKRAYRLLNGTGSTKGIVTVNSKYMEDLLAPHPVVRIPNGVDDSLADVEHHGSSDSRLLLLGEFFQGRTDFDLLKELAMRPEFDEIVICAPGDSRPMSELVTFLARELGPKLQVHDWVELAALGGIIGSRTAALIPHLVRDYTLSQDLMKVYQLLSLGVRILCPRLLWPAGVDMTYGLLLDHGISLDDVLADWLASPPPSSEWRRQFAVTNSWTARARDTAELLTAS